MSLIVEMQRCTLGNDFNIPFLLFAVQVLKNIGPQCVENRRSVGSSQKLSKQGARDCTLDIIQACVTITCSMAQHVNCTSHEKNKLYVHL